MLLNRVNPSVVVPGILAPQLQNVDFEKYIGHKSNLGDLADEMIYLPVINNINSETSVGQQWASPLTQQSATISQVSLPFYQITAHVTYDIAESAKFEKLTNGVSYPLFLEALAKQGINQRKHQGILSGFDSTTPYGILANATIANFASDSAGVDNITGYKTNELQALLVKYARQVMDASFGTLKPTIIASSVRVINYLKTAVVPTGEYLKSGGVDSVGGSFSEIVGKWLETGQLQFIADDYLKEAGTQQKDLILFIASGMDSQGGFGDDINQNLAGEFNNITYNTFYDACAGLMQHTKPEIFGEYSAQYKYKMSPGATLRSEAVLKIEAKYA